MARFQLRVRQPRQAMVEEAAVGLSGSLPSISQALVISAAEVGMVEEMVAEELEEGWLFTLNLPTSLLAGWTW